MRPFTLAACLAGVALLGSACQEPPPPPAGTPAEAATEGLETLKALVTPQNYARLGFQTQGEVQQAALEKTPLEVDVIDFAKLQGFAPGQVPESLITRRSEVLYVVTVSGGVRTSMTVAPFSGGYEAVNFGDAAMIRQYARFRAPRGDRLVRSPEMGLDFIGRVVNGQSVLVPLDGLADTRLRRGQQAPLGDVLGELAPIARTYTDAPS